MERLRSRGFGQLLGRRSLRIEETGQHGGILHGQYRHGLGAPANFDELARKAIEGDAGGLGDLLGKNDAAVQALGRIL